MHLHDLFQSAVESTIHRSVILLLCTIVMIVSYPFGVGGCCLVVRQSLGRPRGDIAMAVFVSYGVWPFIDNLEDMEVSSPSTT